MIDDQLTHKPPTMNETRADWAAAAIAVFMLQTGSDLEDSLGDLLCGLMHWADRDNFDFALALDRATYQYKAELAEEVCVS
jgi:hypothetical protein